MKIDSLTIFLITARVFVAEDNILSEDATVLILIAVIVAGEVVREVEEEKRRIRPG